MKSSTSILQPAYYAFDVDADRWYELFVNSNLDNDRALMGAVITVYNEAGEKQLAQATGERSTLPALVARR